jgi:hypothetical protein
MVFDFEPDTITMMLVMRAACFGVVCFDCVLVQHQRVRASPQLVFPGREWRRLSPKSKFSARNSLF